MKHISYNEGKGAPLLFIGGWGQRLASPNTRWLLDTAAEAGYSVHACEIADAMTNFAADYLAPATALQTQLKPALILAHSTGGLIAAHLPHQERRVYMSPWWGIFGFKLRKWIRLVAKISSAVRWLPIDFTRDELGDLVTDGDWQGVPKTISPRFVSEIIKAQDSLPGAAPDDVVFCSLRDTIIALDAVGRRIPPDRLVLYNGGHELYSSSSRESIRPRLIQVLKKA